MLSDTVISTSLSDLILWSPLLALVLAPFIFSVLNKALYCPDDGACDLRVGTGAGVYGVIPVEPPENLSCEWFPTQCVSLNIF